MSRLEMLERYVRMAHAAGTLVEFIAENDLPPCLTSILSEPAESRSSAHTGSLSVHPDQASIPQSARIAALPASGWPQGLRESVEIIIAACGCQTIMPRKAPDGYTWDRDRLARASVGIIYCGQFLADTGSLVLPSGPGMGTLAALLPEICLALSHAEGCRGSLADYLTGMSRILPSRLTLVTGPSRTGDIEATMTTGVHGPRKVLHYILL